MTAGKVEVEVSEVEIKAFTLWARQEALAGLTLAGPHIKPYQPVTRGASYVINRQTASNETAGDFSILTPWKAHSLYVGSKLQVISTDCTRLEKRRCSCHRVVGEFRSCLQRV